MKFETAAPVLRSCLNSPSQLIVRMPFKRLDLLSPSGPRFVTYVRPGRTSVALLSLVIAALASSGCQLTPPKTFSADRPSQHSVTTEHFVIKSDVPLDANDPVVEELKSLREQVITTLGLGPQRDPVVVYLFSDETTYRYYMQTTWSNLPPRRAYFVGTSRELAIYSYRSPRMLEDLRHEFTHGILHATLQTVPLWLDEGLAEYFEVGGPEPGRPHAEHVQELMAAGENGWRPNLFQLELINDFQKLSRRDYAESWAWVHYMLHSQPETKDVLIGYLTELSTSTAPRRLMPQLEKAFPDYYAGVRRHVAAMGPGLTTTAALP